MREISGEGKPDIWSAYKELHGGREATDEGRWGEVMWDTVFRQERKI